MSPSRERREAISGKRLADLQPHDKHLNELRDRLRKGGPDSGLFNDCVERLTQVVKQLQEEFLDRQESIEMLVASTMAGVPALLFGPPGTAKSLMVRRMAELCGVDTDTGYFEYLVTQHTMPEELFGPPNIEELTERSRFIRATERMLPAANFAFLDEIFRGSGHILNALLSIINEKKFHNGHEVLDVPLVTVVGAANRPPDDPELEAFFDRFPIRIWVGSVLDGPGKERRDNAAKLFDYARRLENPQYTGPIACLSDFVVAQEYLRAETWNPGEEEAGQTFLDAFLQFRAPCRLSDRSLFDLTCVARALDELAGGNDSPERLLAVFPHTAKDLRLSKQVKEQVNRQVHGGGHTTRP